MKFIVALFIAGLLFSSALLYGVAWTEGREDGYLDGYCDSNNANETLCAGRGK